MNKRNTLRIICILLGVMMLCGCTGKKDPSDQADKAKDSKPAKEEQKKEKKEKKKDKKQGKKNKTGTDDGSWVSLDSGEDPATEYEPIISEIREVINNGYDQDRNYDYISDGIMERTMYPGDDDLSEVIGYKIMDVNGDGTMELLVGENMPGELDDTSDISYIYSGFTINDGKPVCFLEGWARNRVHYMGDGYFFISGSSGAMNTVFGKYHLSKEGTIEWDDLYFTMEDAATSGLALFHNTTGIEDPNVSERLRMSEDEFWDIMNGYKCEPVSWTPIGRTAGAKDDGNKDKDDMDTHDNGMLIPDSDSRYLTEDDLKGFDAAELRIARNEIYARHGRKFNDKELMEYFEKMDWYTPEIEAKDFDEGTLNDYEKQNLMLIGRMEKNSKQ